MGDYTRRSYHSSWPSWRRGESLTGPLIGIELEVEANSDSYETLLELLPNFPPDQEPLTECDGSLDDECGVEIIFPPFPYNEVKKKSSVVGQCLSALDGHVYAHTETGMHMNVNVRQWSLRDKQLFSAMIHNLSEHQIKHLGGRAPNHYCSLVRNMPLTAYSELINDHAWACELQSRGARLELRFPQSTTDHKRIELLVDFIERLEKFVKTIPADWSPPGRRRRVGGLYYGYEEERYSYEELYTNFYKFLNKTKKGRRVLRVLTKGFEAFDEPDEKKPKTTTRSRVPARAAAVEAV